MNRFAARSGDLVLGCGSSWWPSKFIALVTCIFSPGGWMQLLLGQWFSHVGIIYRDGLRMKIAETTTLHDPSEPRPVLGVQTHLLEEWVDNYDGEVWILRLKKDRGLDAAGRAELRRLIEEKRGLTYSKFSAFLAGTLLLKQAWFWWAKYGEGCCSLLVTWLLDNVERWRGTLHVSPAKLARVGVEIEMYDTPEKIKCRLASS